MEDTFLFDAEKREDNFTTFLRDNAKDRIVNKDK